MGPIKVNFGGGNRQKAVVISPEKAVLKTIINIIGTIAAVIVLAFMLFMLFRPYKEATKLTKDVKIK